MKILDNSDRYGEHVNFIDNNDTFVGYSLAQCCCECAGWFIQEDVVGEDVELYDLDCEKVPDVEDYFFDRDFFKHVSNNSLDRGGIVVFRLVAEGKPNLYLHLYNCHNGYYGHGFTVKHRGEIVKEDYL